MGVGSEAVAVREGSAGYELQKAKRSVPVGYKQTEVGVIPEDWDAQPLGQIANFRTGPFGSALHKSDYITDGIPVINPMHIIDGKIEPTRTMSITEEAAKSLSVFQLKPGDIVIGRRGDMGRCAIVLKNQDGWLCGTGSMIVRSVGFDAHFLQRVLSSPRVISDIEASSVGTTMVNLNQSTLAGLKVQVPSDPEQRAIAAALGDMDALLDGLDRLIAKKRDLKQAAMQQLLTGQTRLPGFEGEWEVKRLGDVGRCLRGVSYRGDSDLSQYDTEHTKRLLRSNNVQNSSVVTDDVQFVNIDRVEPLQILSQQDILLCMANGSKALVGKSALFTINDGYEYTFGAFMGCFRTNPEVANSNFVFCLFQTGLYRDYINNLLAGSSINNLRPSSIESLHFSLPQLGEQTAIATVLSNMDAEIEAFEQRRKKTYGLKQAMMQELLTGRTRLL